jgi:23S rRNA pseudouridine2605 synthase
MRINKFIASNSQISRRKADELIEEGLVSVNGKKVEQLGMSIDPSKDKVFINNKEITPQHKEELIYIALNKPEGYISTRSDELNRQTIMDLVPKNKNLKPVGRLDKDTEGLIFLSNDGDFINRLTHPKFECTKTYYVKIKGELTLEEKDQLEKGIILEGKKTSPSKVQFKEKNEKETICLVTIHEGRNRQIRKMFDYFKHPVKYLQRVAIGPVTLGSLKKGTYRELTQNEINAY